MVAQKPSSSHSLEAQSGTAARQALTRKQAADSNGSAAANGNSPGEERRGLLPGASPPSDSSAWDGAMLAQVRCRWVLSRWANTTGSTTRLLWLVAVSFCVAWCTRGSSLGLCQGYVTTKEAGVLTLESAGTAQPAQGAQARHGRGLAGRVLCHGCADGCRAVLPLRA